jgi:hypothetical protein
MARQLSKGKNSKKDQGKGVTGASQSATNVFPEWRTIQRGLGSAYAYAINKMIDEAPQTRGSLNPFLGVESKRLDPVSYGRYSLLPKDFDPRKK